MSSVLGKRTRSNSGREEALTQQRSRKRIAQSIPQIFEDASDHDCDCRRTLPDSERESRHLSSRQSLSRSFSDKAVREAEESVRESVEDAENRPPPRLLDTPSTIRYKNVLVTASPSTPKRKIKSFSLTTLRTPKANQPRVQDVYTRAKQLFAQSSGTSNVIGRDTEKKQVRDFIRNAERTKQGGCTYISGPPGTGKSAVMHEIIQEYRSCTDVRVSIVNCATTRTISQVYSLMLQDLTQHDHESKTNPQTQLRRLFTSKSSSNMHIVFLDEIDSLVDSECEGLYSIFEWALYPSSSLILVGIANALDLTDRFLPRLKFKRLRPQLLPFLPYDSTQIENIITGKLRSLSDGSNSDFIPVMHPAAIKLCCKKISSQSGDLRKAFGLIRRTIEQVESEASAKGPLTEVRNIDVTTISAVKYPATFCSYTAETAPRATIAHVAKLSSSIFNNGTTSRLAGLNLQQKAVLCSLVKKETRRQSRDPFSTPSKSSARDSSIAELLTAYTNLCKKDQGVLQPLKETEFRDVVASLETLGLVHESRARSGSLLTPSSSSPLRIGRANHERQVISAVVEKELRASLVGPGADLLLRLLDRA